MPAARSVSARRARGSRCSPPSCTATPKLARDDVLERFTAGVPGVTVYEEQDYSAPYASGSAKVDGYVVCPCSMATVGTIAAGAMSNLVHRAASVALKEGRRLVLVPRETPLSSIHLENLLRLRNAGAVILFAAPGFYHEPRTVDDLVGFVVARCLDQLGVENAVPRAGAMGADVSSGRLAPDDVRAMFDRITPVYDVMNRVMTAGLDRRWRRLAAEAVVRPGDRRRRMLRNRRPRACGAGGGRPRDRPRLLRSGCSNVRAASRLPSSGSRATRSRSRFPIRASTAPPSASACATSPTSRAAFASCAASSVRAGASPVSRSRCRRARRTALPPVVLPGRPASGRVLPGGGAYTYLPASVRRFPGPRDLAAICAQAGFSQIRWTLLGGGIVALHTADSGRRASERDRDHTVRSRASRATSSGSRRGSRTSVASHPGLVAEVGTETLAAGGKRLRPVLVFLSTPPHGAPEILPSPPARPSSSCTWRRSCMTTCSTERISVAGGRPPGRSTASQPRRRPATISSRAPSRSWPAPGTPAAVAVLADAALALARGEALQRRQAFRPDTTVEDYLLRCSLKTGKLFEAACLLGGGRRELGGFGLALGIAFQIADDILDCTGDFDTTGKVSGVDLRDGTPTLPLLLAARRTRASGTRSPARRWRTRSSESPRPKRSRAVPAARTASTRSRRGRRSTARPTARRSRR